MAPPQITVSTTTTTQTSIPATPQLNITTTTTTTTTITTSKDSASDDVFDDSHWLELKSPEKNQPISENFPFDGDLIDINPIAN
jgi:hypothetical protein